MFFGLRQAICLGCGREVPRNATVCRACDRPNQIDCPVCHAPMEAVTHERLRLDMCRKCDGIWFDSGELPRLLDGKLNPTVLAAKGFRPEEAAAVAQSRGDPSGVARVVQAFVNLLFGWL